MAAADRLHAKGLLTQADGGYLTSLGRLAEVEDRHTKIWAGLILDAGGTVPDSGSAPNPPEGADDGTKKGKKSKPVTPSKGKKC